MRGRRSIRSYSDAPLTLAEVSQLLWAAQGITNDRGFRTAPSAGALYPLEVYVVAGKVEGLPAGIYKYRPREHELWRVDLGDKRRELSGAALGQEPVADGAIDIVFAAVYGRTAVKYGERATRYVHIEVGHAAQNVFLQAGALDLGAAVIGAFFDEEVE
ncbi:nitroreductase, partial [candidate division TA06 bacterium DG_24]